MTAIVHLVAWRLNGADAQLRAQQAQRIVEAFHAARPQWSGLERLEIGPNIIAAADAWDLGLCMVFATRADLDAYQLHPAHQAIKALAGPMRAARVQVDFELPP